MRACVRNVDDDTRVGFLKAMNPYASGRLTLHAADLDQPGCFDEIFRGSDAVAHVSHVSTYDDPEYVRGPATTSSRASTPRDRSAGSW